MSNLTELRKATRYRWTPLAVLRWLGADDELSEALALVRDISTCGAYVESSAELPVSTYVELEITAPGFRPYTPGLSLHFEGRIVRTEKHHRRMGLVVAGFLYLSPIDGPGC